MTPQEFYEWLKNEQQLAPSEASRQRQRRYVEE